MKSRRHQNYLESIDVLEGSDPDFYHYLMTNHYSKYIDLEDHEFSNGKLRMAMFYIKNQLFFECDEKLA